MIRVNARNFAWLPPDAQATLCYVKDASSKLALRYPLYLYAGVDEGARHVLAIAQKGRYVLQWRADKGQPNCDYDVKNFKHLNCFFGVTLCSPLLCHFREFI